MANKSDTSDDFLLGQKAAESKELQSITREVCQWLSQMLDVEITDTNYMEKLETGVLLCRLQNKLCPTLGGQPIEYHEDAEKYPQLARQNIEHFVKWCNDLKCSQLFEPNDLVIRKSKLNEKKEQEDQDMKKRCRRVIWCLCQIKQKYESAIQDKGEAGTHKNDETKEVTETMTEETDSKDTVITTQAQGTDPDQSDAVQSSETPPEPQCKDKEEETSDNQNTAPDESKPSPAVPSSDESLREVRENEKKDREITPKPATTAAQPTPDDSNNTFNAPAVIQRYFYPVLFVCILPLVFLGGFYFLKRRK